MNGEALKVNGDFNGVSFVLAIAKDDVAVF